MDTAAGTPLSTGAGVAPPVATEQGNRPVRPGATGPAVAVALLAGVSMCLALPALPDVRWLGALFPAGLLLWWRGGRVRWSGALLFGFALAGLHATQALSLQLPAAPVSRDAVVGGQVVGLPQPGSRRTRFLFRVDEGPGQPAALRGRLLRLAWYDGFDGGATGRGALRAGQRWRFEVRVRAPRGLRNPGGFDSEKHALARRLAGEGYVREPQLATRLRAASGIDAWRGAMSFRIARDVDLPAGRFVRALALGDTRALDNADWQVLRANGLTHLVAISGFHVGLVAGFFALFAAGAWRLWPGLGRRCPRPVAAALMAVLGAMLYAAVAGFALATVRTVLMIAVVATVRVLRRPVGGFQTLALAAIAVLLVDPLAVLGAGFWLSFLGVAWLLWCLPRPGRRPLRDFLSAQGVATLGLLPLTVVLFGQASLAGPVANLLAVPWWSLVVVPLSLLGTALEALHAGWGTWAWQLAAWCFQLPWPLFEWLAGSGLALVWLPEAKWFALPLALAGAFWLLLPRGLPGRPLALLLWLPLLWPAGSAPPPGGADVTVLDVGQGLSVLVRTHGHALLYDMGAATPGGFDTGERIVVPALRALGVRRLDRAVASHADNDHAGGLDAVRRLVPVGVTLAPQGSGLAGTRPCVAGRGWRWDGVEFRFLHPAKYFPYLGNEASCVLRIESSHGVVLLTGDIGDVIERDLLRRDRAAVRADVVMAAHHGSDSASDPGFVRATGARHVLFSTAYGNRFGHPRAEVVERWRQAGARPANTAGLGAITVRLTGQGVEVTGRRRSHPRLWDATRERR